MQKRAHRPSWVGTPYARSPEPRTSPERPTGPKPTPPCSQRVHSSHRGTQGIPEETSPPSGGSEKYTSSSAAHNKYRRVFRRTILEKLTCTFLATHRAAHRNIDTISNCNKVNTLSSACLKSTRVEQSKPLLLKNQPGRV